MSRAILDTHTFLWYATDDPAIGKEARSAILDPSVEKLVSAATVWEISIKVALGKLDLTMPFDQLIAEGIEGSGFSLLPVLPRHASRLITLPHLHRDPFDRMLVAQALCEGCAIIGRDPDLSGYGVPCIW